MSDSTRHAVPSVSPRRSTALATWIWEISSDRVYGDANMFAMFNLPPGTSNGVPAAVYLNTLHPDDRPVVVTLRDEAVASGEDFVAEYRIINADAIRWAYASARVERDAAGRSLRLTGVVLDITDRKAAEAALLADARQHDALLDLQRAVTTSAFGVANPTAAVLDAAARHVLAVIPAAMASVLETVERDATGQEVLHYRAAAGTLAGYVGVNIPRAGSLSGRCMDEGRPLICNDVETDPRVHLAAARRLNIRSMIVVPIPRGGVNVGVLKVASSETNAFTEADTVAVQLAIGAIVGGLSGVAETQAMHALERSEAEFRLLADAMPQIVFTARPDGTVDYYNQRWYAYTGFNPALIGRDSWERVHMPEDLERVADEWFRAIHAGTPYEGEQRYRCAADGVFRWHLVRAVPVRDGAGRVVRWFGTSTDIHDFKTLQAEREGLLAAEQAARGEVEKASRLKDEFLATLSHELRTPLNAILGWAHILKTSPSDPEIQGEALTVIERNARAQKQIIEEILDLSRIISGTMRLDVQSVDLVTIVRAGMDTVQPAALAKGVELTLRAGPSLGPVRGDARRLQQVFWNLISNAVKFTPKDGRVQVLLVQISTHIEVRVTDTGEGIDPAFLPYVFDRFRQADSSTTRRHGGLGIGLSIVKQLVELHGGTVRATSTGRGQGATFAVDLPVAETHSLSNAAAPDVRRASHPFSAADPHGDAQLRGMRILVVDDEPDTQSVIKRMLQDRGASVSTASSASEALRRFADDRPAVLVSDIGMPGEDGYALIRSVRALADAEGGRTPAVALTAYARPTDRAKALEAGFQAHLAKPVEPAQLISTVAAMAKLHSRA